MVIEMYLCLENKSLTNVGEFWEVKSWIVVGDEEYVYLHTLFRVFLLRIPALLFEENSAGEH